MPNGSGDKAKGAITLSDSDFCVFYVYTVVLTTYYVQFLYYLLLALRPAQHPFSSLK